MSVSGIAISAVTTASSDVDHLRDEVKRLEELLVLTNDAAFVMSGILSRALVESGLMGRQELSEIVERKAGPIDAHNHNPLLARFARCVRMNFPGGSFDLLPGGRTD